MPQALAEKQNLELSANYLLTRNTVGILKKKKNAQLRERLLQKGTYKTRSDLLSCTFSCLALYTLMIKFSFVKSVV